MPRVSSKSRVDQLGRHARRSTSSPTCVAVEPGRRDRRAEPVACGVREHAPGRMGGQASLRAPGRRRGGRVRRAAGARGRRGPRARAASAQWMSSTTTTAGRAPAVAASSVRRDAVEEARLGAGIVQRRRAAAFRARARSRAASAAAARLDGVRRRLRAARRAAARSRCRTRGPPRARSSAPRPRPPRRLEPRRAARRASRVLPMPASPSITTSSPSGPTVRVRRRPAPTTPLTADQRRGRCARAAPPSAGASSGMSPAFADRAVERRRGLDRRHAELAVEDANAVAVLLDCCVRSPLAAYSCIRRRCAGSCSWSSASRRRACSIARGHSRRAAHASAAPSSTAPSSRGASPSWKDCQSSNATLSRRPKPAMNGPR